MEAEEKRERRRRQRQKVVTCCKKFVTFLFSHIGLAGLVVGYSILGGFLFRWLEAGEEYKEKVRIHYVKEDTIDNLRQIADHYKSEKINVTKYEDQVRGHLVYFQKEVILAVKEKGWDGNDDMGENAVQWSFAGALLYAVTVITTIGKPACNLSAWPNAYLSILPMYKIQRYFGNLPSLSVQYKINWSNLSSPNNTW